MSKIGLLTGTFDPIHLGHLALARAAMHNCALDAVWIMVNSREQSSPSERKDDVVSYDRRLKMAALATAHTTNISVYDGPLARHPHTMDTFMNIMEHHPDDKFVFIVGMDTIARLDGWSNLETVVKQATYAVARRNGASDDSVRALKERLGPLGELLTVQFFSFDQHNLASSMEIRKHLRAGDGPRGLDPAVGRYIEDNRLYS